MHSSPLVLPIQTAVGLSSVLSHHPLTDVGEENVTTSGGGLGRVKDVDVVV